ncbi:MAG: phosphotriesterase-related protein [candidate division NC10 bacterium]|nr:phosphotriesterase-related protein [candidate division NC10 bacterium]
MARSVLSGRVQTVLGPVASEAMGVTLPHEHLLVDISCVFTEPQAASDKALASQPVGLENLGWVRYHWTSNLDNLKLLDEPMAVEEALRYRWAGGQTIIDPTNIGLGRDPAGLARIARATGLQIVMGAGYYVGLTHPPEMGGKRDEELAQEIIRDVTEGVGETGIRAGLIGEIGCSWPWTENEQKSVRAAVWAQRETGAPLMIHPGRHEKAPMEILEVVRQEGGELHRTIMCHIERTITEPRQLFDLAATGCYLEYDLFGLESSYFPFNPAFDLPSDGQRMEQVTQLIEAGHLAQLLLSHDICTKVRLTKFGGHGYHHLLVNIVPRLRRKGLDEAAILTLLVENPRRAFTFA